MSRKTPPKKYPPLPTTVDCPGGTVEVVKLPVVKHQDGSECWGLWEDNLRRISIDETAPMRHQWLVFYHELTHVAITDAGLDNVLDKNTHEAICDAIGTMRMRERFGG